MPKLSAVLFDLDGTLVNTNQLIVASFQHTFRTCLGREVPAEEIMATFGEPLPATLQRYGSEHGADADRMLGVYREFNSAQHDVMTSQFAGVTQGLSQLHQAGVRLAVVTSKYTALALRGLRLFGYDALMETVVGLDQTARHKPDPEGCLLALERLGVAPGPHVAMVGDSPYDLEAGRRAGVRTVAAGWSAIDRNTLLGYRPDFWADSFLDLVTYCLEGPAQLPATMGG